MTVIMRWGQARRKFSGERAHVWLTLVIGIAGTLLAGCEQFSAVDDPAASAIAAGHPGRRLNALVEGYYDSYLELNPLVATANGDGRFNDRLPNSLSEQWLADMLAMEQEALMQLDSIDPAALDENDRLTYEQFRYGRELAIEGFRFPEELLPVSQFSSLPVFFGQMGSGGSIQPFANVKDYEDFLARIEAFVAWIEQAIVNMRAGIAQGVVQPRIVVERSIPQIASFLVDDVEDSVFFAPLKAFPDTLPTGEHERITAAYAAAIRDELLPAYRRLHDFLRDEYLPAARPSLAMTALPNGAAWYAYLVRLHTTTRLTADQIHRIGLEEVRQIRAEMEAVKNRVRFAGTLSEFFRHLRTDPAFRFESKEQMLATYGGIGERIAPRLPELFARYPRSPYEVREVESYRAVSAAAASYMPGTPDGKRPGIFYVNTYDLSSRPNYMAESIFLHEAIPGHHFQISLQREIDMLPRFRRFGGDTAYIEGWGLYAESLGQELGLYQDPYQYFGALTAEMWRAVRLVVDTGLHAQDWSREQAIDFMRQHTALSETDILAEVERYIATPGQALAYKVGQRKLKELRERATRALGDRFDLREFHTAILDGGSMPLEVLDAKLARWEEESRP